MDDFSGRNWERWGHIGGRDGHGQDPHVTFSDRRVQKERIAALELVQNAMSTEHLSSIPSEKKLIARPTRQSGGKKYEKAVESPKSDTELDDDPDFTPRSSRVIRKRTFRKKAKARQKKAEVRQKRLRGGRQTVSLNLVVPARSNSRSRYLRERTDAGCLSFLSDAAVA